MPSQWTPNLKIQKMGTGENTGTWGNVTNTNLEYGLEEAIVGTANVTFNGSDENLPIANSNASQTYRNLRLNLVGTSGGARQLTVPAVEKTYIVKNNLADTCTVLVSGQTGVAVPSGKTMWLYNDGTDVRDVTTYLSNLALGTPLPVSSGGTGSNTGVNVQTTVSGILPVANGGTGSATAAFNGSGITNLNATAISSGTIANTYTTANAANQSNAIVVRDSGGNFAANTITANLTGSASLNLLTSSFTGAGNQSLTSNGYQKLPGGLIIQWGTDLDTNTAINFPIPFPNAAFSMTATVTPTGDLGSDCTVEILSTSQFRLRSGTTTGNNNCHWIAIGY